MKLYHGTRAVYLPRILEEGLLPRDTTGTEGNWDECPSRPDMVYLTTAYAPYFAFSATEAVEEDWLIVEIDGHLLDEALFHPDEDYVEQAQAKQIGIGRFGMEERTAFIRSHLEDFQVLWKDSLDGLGNVAYKGPITPEHITRVVVYEPKSNPSITMDALNPAISLANFHFCGWRYQELMKWFMLDDFDYSRLIMGWQVLPDVFRAQASAAYEKRDGIKVVLDNR